MSENKTKYDNFNLTLDQCKAVLDTIGGLIIVDKDGKIKYFSEDIIEAIEHLNAKKIPLKLTDKQIVDVHPTTKIQKALEKNAKDALFIYNGCGVANITRIMPVKSNDGFEGAIDLDIFSSSWELALFLKRINRLISEGSIRLPKVVDDIYEIPKKSGVKYSIGDLVGISKQMQDLRNQIYKLLESKSTVLITGETGTGKEIVAHAIYGVSGRQMYPFIQVNCAAIPESLFEAELFGYEEGSFTGGNKGGKAGLFEEAHNGTVFLDEVDQIPYNMQPKLLRVLQEQEVLRIGGVKKKPINVRIIAATNKDLKKSITEQKFREDLYYRLNVININIPPLRERKEDIPALIAHRCEYLSEMLNRNIKGVTAEAMKIICQYDWPGNIRELFNIIERNCNMCTEEYLSADYFADIILGSTFNPGAAHFNGSLEAIMEHTEKNVIEKALAAANNNKTRAAEILGIGRTSLHNKIKKYKIT